MTYLPNKDGEVIVIAGPTAVGKTAIAVELARRCEGEIISADSMQVYRHLSIGTAKPSREELRDVPCHLIDCVEPDHQFNLGDYVAAATPIVENLLTAQRFPIVCGGTGLYIKGLLHGVFGGETRNQRVRETLKQRASSEGLHVLYEELERFDPEAASQIMPTDGIRICRALEVWHTTGKPISELQQQHSQPPRWPTRYFVLSISNELLNERIDQRVHAMVERGLVEEIEKYQMQDFSLDNPALRALGYRELIESIEGKRSLENALEAMIQKSRQYAKRQRTWFRSVKNATDIDLTGKTVESACDEIASMCFSLA